MLQVSIYRYDPAQDSEPYMKEYQVETHGKDMICLLYTSDAADE